MKYQIDTSDTLSLVGRNSIRYYLVVWHFDTLRLEQIFYLKTHPLLRTFPNMLWSMWYKSSVFKKQRMICPSKCGALLRIPFKTNAKLMNMHPGVNHWYMTAKVVEEEFDWNFRKIHRKCTSVGFLSLKRQNDYSVIDQTCSSLRMYLSLWKQTPNKMLKIYEVFQSSVLLQQEQLANSHWSIRISKEA